MTNSLGVEIKNEREMLKREENGEYMNSPESVRYIVIHCSATREDRPYTVEQLRRDHRARGFRKIGYHFYIRRDGTVSQHRHLLEVGAHCRPYNRCSIGICYEGGVRADGSYGDTRTWPQRQSMDYLVAEMQTLFPAALVVGHRDLPGTTPKECPCFDVKY